MAKRERGILQKFYEGARHPPEPQSKSYIGILMSKLLPPRLDIDPNKPLSMPRPVPKPSQSSKKRGRKPNETKDESQEK